MSEIRANTVSNAAGTGPVTLTGQYAAKAWVNFNGTGTVAIRQSGNVSSITDNSTGNYTVNFTTAMTDANYAPTTSSDSNPTSWGGIQYQVSMTSSAYRFINVDNQISGSGANDASTLTVTATR